MKGIWVILGVLGLTLGCFLLGYAGDAQVVKIGVVYPLSGPFASFGISDKQAIELAVEDINAQGGVHSLGGAKIQVIFADSQGDPKTTMTATERLITQDHVVALIGSILSSTTATMAPVCERYKTPMVNGGSTSITLTQHGWKYFFRTTPDDGLYCKGTLDFLRDLTKKTGVKVERIGLMYENTLFGTTAGDVWKKLIPEYGWKLVANIPYDAKSVDLSSEITKLKNANPDVVFLASYAQDAILITKTRKELNFNPKAVIFLDGGQALKAYLNAVGDLGNYLFGEARWAPDINKPLAQKVNAEFKAKYGRDMDGHNSRAYTAAWALYYAIEGAGSLDKEEIRNALAYLYVPANDIIMAWKGIKFDESGQNILGGPHIVQIQDQTYRTVYPYDIATAKPIFPMPPFSKR